MAKRQEANGRIAYFSMEIAVDPEMPTYAGGLGVLAGDTIRAAADLRTPLVAVTLLHRKGYFLQKLDAKGIQTEGPSEWNPEKFLTPASAKCEVTIEGKQVAVTAWRYDVKGITGYVVPVYFLDTDLPENSPEHRTFTDFLYGGDERYRLCQEAILGIGGVRILSLLGYRVDRFHMNEGHASLLGMELLEQSAKDSGRTEINADDVANVRDRCIFTTHTPVAAGHDKFTMDLVLEVLGNHQAFEMHDVFCCEGQLNLTYLALNLSSYVNGVARKHGEVSRLMYAGYTIDSITNGIHAATWVSKPIAKLLDQYVPAWRQDNFNLRYALSIPVDELWIGHNQAKDDLLKEISETNGIRLDPEVFTIGFARRSTEWKRPNLIFHNLDVLRTLSDASEPFQIVFAGKAHPKDVDGKEQIKKVFEAIEELKGRIKVVYLPNYDVNMAKKLVAGVDIWLNTPRPPQEASGTSGMKAAVNGVPSLSTLDGWWIEGRLEGITGWAIEQNSSNADDEADAIALYMKLRKVLRLFYKDRDKYVNVMLHAIALNGSFFNTHRMMMQYVLNAYFLGGNSNRNSTNNANTFIKITPVAV